MGTINTITDLKNVFGDMPFNSVQPTLTTNSKFPTGKTLLIGGGVVLSIIGLYTIFSKVKDRKDQKSKNSALEEMKKYRKSEMEKWDKEQNQEQVEEQEDTKA